MTNPPGAMPPLPEQAWWLSHDVLAQKNRIDKLPVQSLQPGAYQHTKLYTADQLQAYAATLIARVAELQAALDSTNKALEAIGDYAHDRSTGPAQWDPLWEIRAMAYDNLCFVGAALTPTKD